MYCVGVLQDLTIRDDGPAALWFSTSQPADQPDQPDPGLRAHPGPPTLCKSCASLAPLRLDRVPRQSEPLNSFQIRNRSSVALFQFCPFSSGLQFLVGASEKKEDKKEAHCSTTMLLFRRFSTILCISVAADAAVLYCRIVKLALLHERMRTVEAPRRRQSKFRRNRVCGKPRPHHRLHSLRLACVRRESMPR